MVVKLPLGGAEGLLSRVADAEYIQLGLGRVGRFFEGVGRQLHQRGAFVDVVDEVLEEQPAFGFAVGIPILDV